MQHRRTGCTVHTYCKPLKLGYVSVQLPVESQGYANIKVVCAIVCTCFSVWLLEVRDPYTGRLR